jgi:hypothetical protein
MFDALAQENLITDDFEVGEEEDTFSNEALFEANVALEAEYAQLGELTQMSATLDDLEHLAATIKLHGVTPSLLAFSNRDKLLSSVVSAFTACEALTVTSPANAPESIAAYESLITTIKDMAAGFFKKAWDAIVSGANAVAGFCGAIYDKATSALGWVKDKVFNAAKAAKEFIVAHPIASIVAGLTLAIGLGALLTTIWGPLPMTAEALSAFKSKAFSAISSKFNAARVTVTQKGGDGLNFVWDKMKATKRAAGSALGYTAETFHEVAGKVGDAFGAEGSVTRSAEWVKDHSKSLWDKVSTGGEAGLKYARMGLSFLVGVSKDLWRFFTSGIGSMVTSVFGMFKGLFGTKEQVEAYKAYGDRKPEIGGKKTMGSYRDRRNADN